MRKTMNSYERTVNFIKGETVDHPPFHPIIMRWAEIFVVTTNQKLMPI